jgi:hypothetical protein
MSKAKRVTAPAQVSATHDRMIQISEAIMATSHKDPMIEYSALLCTAAGVMVASRGMPPTKATLGRVIRIIADKVIPAIEAEIGERLGGAGGRVR